MWRGPRRHKNPTTSVMVVKITPPAKAGSMFIALRMTGKEVPQIAATTKLITIAIAMINPMVKSENHQLAILATTVAHNKPLRAPTMTSLLSRYPMLLCST